MFGFVLFWRNNSQNRNGNVKCQKGKNFSCGEKKKLWQSVIIFVGDVELMVIRHISKNIVSLLHSTRCIISHTFFAEFLGDQWSCVYGEFRC